MRAFIAILALVCLCEARPSRRYDAGARAFSGTSYIIGGSDAAPHSYPWQGSQERNGGHSCGCTILNANNALSASHCVDGAAVGILDVIAGLHYRDDTSTAQSTPLSDYTMHANYDDGSATFANDIATLQFQNAITEDQYVTYATIPASNANDFAGQTAVLTGWGRTGSSNALPNTLQQVSIEIVSSAECQNLMAGVSGVEITGNHICFYDTAENAGSCNGDSGGPANLNGQVIGVTSFGISNALGNCLQTYPSVYTRTSAYITWIGNNS